jgi:hypothetical protein
MNSGEGMHRREQNAQSKWNVHTVIPIILNNRPKNEDGYAGDE